MGFQKGIKLEITPFCIICSMVYKKFSKKQSYFWLLFEVFQKIWDECHLEKSLKSICFYTFRIMSLFLNILLVKIGQKKAKGTECIILIESLVQATLVKKITCCNLGSNSLIFTM